MIIWFHSHYLHYRTYLIGLVACMLAGCDGGNTNAVSTVLIYSPINTSTATVLSQDPTAPSALTLSTRGFRLEVPQALAPDVAIQVCASTNPLPSHVGDVSIEAMDCFTPGTGMAMAATPPAQGMPLVITEGDGHNYYSIERRVTDADSSKVMVNRVEPAIPNQPIYLEVLIDANQDGIASPQERWYATATWK